MNQTHIKSETGSLFNKIRSILIGNLSGKQLSWIKKIYYKFNLRSNYKYDRNIYSRYSFGMTNEYSYENLRGKITLHYHSIEKGMSIENLRLGFGKRAFFDLFYSMDKYINYGFPNNDERFLSAVNIMDAYISYHNKHSYDVSFVEKKYKEYLAYANYSLESSRPNRVFEAKEVLGKINLPFKEFSKSRISVRDFSDKVVDTKIIDEVVEIAMYTPSVCNRQPWNVYVVNNYEKIQRILHIQRGLNSKERKSINLLLAITVDVAYYANNKERNELYVDGGLFSMSILYGLHHEGLAACALNANQGNVELDNEREIIGAKESEKIIMFVAVGHYKEKFTVPLSDRDSKQTHIYYVN